MIADAVVSQLETGAVGVVIGTAGASIFHFLLFRNGLRWTWALAPAAVGGLALLAAIVETWTIALLVGGVVTARWTYILERRSRESGGDARRQAKKLVGPTDVLAKRRALRELREGIVSRPGEFVLGLGSRGRPVSLRFGGASGRHGLLLGASGAGKSNALLWCLARHADAGFGAVVIDMKGDQLLLKRLEAQARAADVDFYGWTLDGGDRWNPLAHGNRSELKDKLIGSEQFTERHYQAMYERYLLNLFRAIEGRPEARDLRTVVRLLDPPELAMFIRDLYDEQAAEEIGAYLARLTPDQARDLRGLADRLALLVEGDHGDLLTSPTDGDEIDLATVIQSGAIVVFSLNSSSYGETAKLIGNMVIQDLKAVCGAIERGTIPRRPAIVAVDEFSGLHGDQVAGLFQRARSAGISVMLATQELADLRRVDEGFDEQVVGNVEWILAGRQNNPASAELVAGMAGTEEVWVHTFQTDDVALRGRASFPRESGMGTKHRGREYLVTPDQIKALGVGRMVLVEKNPHRVEVVDVLPPDHPVRQPTAA